ncbi:MAG: hypothetical protein JWN75_588 [Candidatus Saccharibacteria bacterium]|nr:hypothetical protein [Candidatus Saccharibacteria bacterium]
MATTKITTKSKAASHKAAAKKSLTSKQGLKLPIILMLLPIVGVITSIVLYAITNFLFSATASDASSGLINSESAFSGLVIIINIILFLIGALSVILGPVSFIVGLVLLVTRLKQK